MRQSDEIVQLATALAKTQGQIDDASKNEKNSYFSSKYADLAAVRAVIREPLAANDLAIVQLPKTFDGHVEVETMVIHKSGEFIAETLRMPVSKWDAHGIGSAITYARRYGLMAILGIASYDDDGNDAVDRAPVAAQPPKKETIEIDAKLKKSAEEAASQGSIGLNNWWKTLTTNERNSISETFRAELKKKAADQDGKNK